MSFKRNQGWDFIIDFWKIEPREEVKNINQGWDIVIGFWKIELRKVEENILNKEITVSFCYKNQSQTISMNSTKNDKMIQWMTIWKIIKPFLSDKILYSQKNTLLDKKETIVSNDETTQIFSSTFFSNIVSNLNTLTVISSLVILQILSLNL